MMKNRKTGEIIKALRIQSGLSQEELSLSTQLSLRTIQRIENGETEPRGDSLKRIASALTVPVEELTIKTEVEKQLTSHKEDRSILVFIQLSAFCYLIYTVLGIVAPLLLWLFYKDKLVDADKTGKRVIKQQAIWCTVIAIFYGYILVTKLNHTDSFLLSQQAVIAFSLFLYTLNAVIILFPFIRLFSIRRLVAAFQNIFKFQ